MEITHLIKKTIPFSNIKSFMPWWLKIGFKALVYRLPVGESFLRSIGFFQSEQMEEPEYAYQVFQEHWQRSEPVGNFEQGFTALELGPGDSLFSAQTCRSFGGAKTYLVDVDHFAIENVQSYKSMAAYLKQQGKPTPEVNDTHSLNQIMDECGGVYLTSGLSSLKSLPDNSVDLIWSHAVLEHVYRDEFLEIMEETKRVLSPEGVCSHTVDLQDHLDQSLNNLRFSEDFWESSFVDKSGLYTNRIRYGEMLEIFQKAGFSIKATETKCWEELPIPKSAMNPKFQNLDDEELKVSGFSVVLTPV